MLWLITATNADGSFRQWAMDVSSDRPQHIGYVINYAALHDHAKRNPHPRSRLVTRVSANVPRYTAQLL